LPGAGTVDPKKEAKSMKKKFHPGQRDRGKTLPIVDENLRRKIRRTVRARHREVLENLDWLYVNMPPYFFITMKEEVEAIVNLAERLRDVTTQRKIILTDQDQKLIIARLDIPGSLYDTLKDLPERGISYAELTHSYEPVPGSEYALEIQRFEFDRKSREDISRLRDVTLPRGIRKGVFDCMKRLYPQFDFKELDTILRIIALNNEYYIRISPYERIARILWLYQQGIKHEGLYCDIEMTGGIIGRNEPRLLFSVVNPPQKGFLTQTSEIFQRLNIGVMRSYSLFINTGINPCFLGTFYISGREGALIEKGSTLFRSLRTELYNAQIVSPSSTAYTDYVSRHIVTGEEASLINAFIAFCHTTLAHNQPDRYALEVVKSAFHSHPEITLKLIEVFKNRFDPDMADREDSFRKSVDEAEESIKSYNTGHRYLDDIRRTIFQTCLLFIRHTLKTNFFVPEKHALSFRLSPTYLTELGTDITSDLPPGDPFRITFFFGRYGIGYHIGFSDIARGGWRTIICANRDEYITNSNTLVREVYVLAHTQHFKNKDIYEGGSKMTVILDAEDLESEDAVTQRLYKLQNGFINAFFDIFVTENGIVKNPRVIDYYGDDEPIELGPDENMHDAMIELIAEQSVKRGYLLGIAVMSSKRIGINHKEYGVTSIGVIKFADVAMRELGIDIYNDPFTVKITGGTNGDVAGNSMRLLLERCPRAEIRSIAAGSGGLYDPNGVDHNELGRLVLKSDIVDFDPEKLSPGGFILYRRETKQDGLKELFKKVVRTDSGIEEQWITTDDFHREFDDLIFSVPADLFLPCGGRPETIDGSNWMRLFSNEGISTARVISEGANSYITPDAREFLQKRGIIVLRDASANKCGVISSSYEIIANLLMTEEEFLESKNAYVEDVLSILSRRSEEEAILIFSRWREHNGTLLYTDISDAISAEINTYYARLFSFFQKRPELVKELLFYKVILQHLPEFIRDNRKYRARVKKLPPKILFAILSSEIASSIVYRGGWEVEFERHIREFIQQQFQ
jgi:glutamate dehydrogenase